MKTPITITPVHLGIRFTLAGTTCTGGSAEEVLR